MDANKTAYSHHEAQHQHVSVGTYFAVFFALLVFLGATVFIAHFNLGLLNVFAAMGIATIKALLVVLYFMGVKRSIRITKIYASAAVVWLLIGLVLTFCDYLTRHPIQ